MMAGGGFPHPLDFFFGLKIKVFGKKVFLGKFPKHSGNYRMPVKTFHLVVRKDIRVMARERPRGRAF